MHLSTPAIAFAILGYTSALPAAIISKPALASSNLTTSTIAPASSTSTTCTTPIPVTCTNSATTSTSTSTACSDPLPKPCRCGGSCPSCTPSPPTTPTCDPKAPCSKPVTCDSTKPITEDTKPIDKDTKPTDKDTKPKDKDTKPIDKDTKPIDKNTKPTDKDTKPKDKDTKPKDKDTKLPPSTSDNPPIRPCVTSQYDVWTGAVRRDETKGKIIKDGRKTDVTTLLTFDFPPETEGKTCSFHFDLSSDPAATVSGTGQFDVFVSLAPATHSADTWPSGNLRDQHIGRMAAQPHGAATWVDGFPVFGQSFPCPAGKTYGGELVAVGDADHVEWLASTSGPHIRWS